MKNLVGPASFARWAELAAMGGVTLHLYGKGEARPGRKLGHATRVLPRDSLNSGLDALSAAPL
jgi:5-(carboxyamino)imidazole ribonucleotide synthase